MLYVFCKITEYLNVLALSADILIVIGEPVGVNLLGLVLNEPAGVVLGIVFRLGALLGARIEPDLGHVILLGEDLVNVIALEQVLLILFGLVGILDLQQVNLGLKLPF